MSSTSLLLPHHLQRVECQLVTVLPVLPPHRPPVRLLPVPPAVQHYLVQLPLERLPMRVPHWGELSLQLSPLLLTEGVLVLLVRDEHLPISILRSNLLQNLSQLQIRKNLRLFGRQPCDRASGRLFVLPNRRKRPACCHLNKIINLAMKYAI